MILEEMCSSVLPYFFGLIVCMPVGAFSQVRDQGQTESCYAFAIASAMHLSLYCQLLQAGMLIDSDGITVSQQELLDCLHIDFPPPHTVVVDPPPLRGYGNTVHNAINYITTRGVNSRSNYDWVGECGPCRAASLSGVLKLFTHGCYEFCSSDYAVRYLWMRENVVMGGIRSTHSFEMWTGSSIFNYEPDEVPTLPTQPCHLVAIVGYGEVPVNYFIIQNSWGSRWGHRGYAKVPADYFFVYFVLGHCYMR